MPTTRAARRSALCLTEVLPADVLGLVLYYVPLAHDIAQTGLTCRALCDAARLALKARPFSGDVVTLDAFGAEAREHPDFEDFSSVFAAVTPAGQIITCQEEEGAMTLWHGAEWTKSPMVDLNQLTTSVAVLPGAHMLCGGYITVSYDEVTRWSSEFVSEWSVDTDETEVTSLVVLPDGEHMALGMEGRGSAADIRLHRIEDGTLIHILANHTDNVGTLTTTRDGQHIISGANDGRVCVWNVASKSLVSTGEEHTNFVWALSVMPDGKRFLSGSRDTTVRLWLLNGELVNIFSELHDAAVSGLVALPDGHHALSASWDTTIKLFCVDDGSVLRSIAVPQTIAVTWGFHLNLLPDGRRFIATATYGTVLVYEHGLAPQ